MAKVAFVTSLVVIFFSTLLSATPARRYSRKIDGYSKEELHPYSFHYEVDSPYHGIWHDRSEKSTGESTEGHFRIALPDHRLQTVRYQATKDRGFLADVHFEQHPDFSSLRGNIGRAPEIGESVVPAYKSSEKKKSKSIRKEVNLKPDVEHSVFVSSNRGKSFTSHEAVTPKRVSFLPDTPLSAFISLASTNHYSSTKETLPRPVTVNPHFRINNHKQERKNKPETSTRAYKSEISIPLKSKPETIKLAPKYGDRYRPKPKFESRKPSQSYKNSRKENEPSEGKSDIIPVSRNSRKKHTKNLANRTSIRGRTKSTSRNLEDSLISNEIPHKPDKDEPVQIDFEPPATQNQIFSVVGKENRYKIRREGMEDVMSRLKGIVHN